MKKIFHSYVRSKGVSLLLFVSLLLQFVVVNPVRAVSSPQQGTGTETRRDSSVVLGEAPVLNLEPKTNGGAQQAPSVETLPALADPEKEEVPSTPSAQSRGWTVLMSEGFEGIFPDGLWNPYDDDGATNGEYFWDDVSYTAYTGNWSAWVANGGADALEPPSQYPNYTNSWMVYGPFDLSNYSSAELSFYYWNRSEPGYDYFGWFASGDGSHFSGTEVAGDSGGWVFQTLDLTPYAGDSSVWIAFRFISDSIVTAEGAFVDDVTLSVNAPTTDEWTFLVYLDGDNDLEYFGVEDFLEMSQIGSTSEVNIVVEMDRNPNFDNRYDDWTDTRRFLVTQYMEPTEANGTSIGEANMGDPQTLIDFVQWGMSTYPANHYALVLWDHGSGWRSRNIDEFIVKSIAIDFTNGDSLDMPDLRNAMDTLTNHGSNPIDLLGMDACLMAMAEVDNQFIPFAKVRVGSEKTEPGAGWQYETLLRDLVGNPTMTAAGLGTVIVDRYYESYNNDQIQSAVNLGAPYNTLNTAIDNFAKVLIAQGVGYTTAIQAARNHTQVFDDGTPPTYVDLYDFAYQVTQRVNNATIKTAAIALMNAIESAVINEHHGSSWPGSHGISIYFPKLASEYDSRYDGSQGFLQFTAITHWDEWLRSYFNYPFIPVLKSPTGVITDTTPVYKWASVNGATQYQLQVYQGAQQIYAAAYNSSICNILGTCAVTPSKVLDAGVYKWRVRTYVQGAWKPFSAFRSFTVKNLGFNSPFTVNASGWSVVKGSWSLVNLNYYKTPGILNRWTSIVHTGSFSTLDYQAKIKRTGCLYCANHLAIRGTTTPLDGIYTWNKEYIFEYTNDQSFSVWKISNGTETKLKGWTYYSGIKKNGWNTLRVIATGTTLKFYINGALVWTGTDSSFASGRVGIGMYRYNDPDPNQESFMVDWAKLSTSVADVMEGDAFEQLAEVGEENLEWIDYRSSPLP